MKVTFQLFFTSQVGKLPGGHQLTSYDHQLPGEMQLSVVFGQFGYQSDLNMHGGHKLPGKV